MAGAPDVLLELRSVTKRYGGLTAVRDVSLSIPRGEVCGVIGPNGAGKSTLFSIISGSTVATSGSIHFAGQDISRLPLHQRARRGIARTFQLAHTFETMTVAENVLLGAENHARLDLIEAFTHLGGFSRKEEEARAKAEESMRVVGITGLAGVAASKLTFGQQRLVTTARALAARPQLLLLDEPAAGLSSGDIELLCQAILNARSFGATVVLVEHNMDVVMRLCDHVIVMHLGEKIGDGTAESVRQSERVVEAYLGT